MPHTSSVPLYWRLRKSKYNLVGSRCQSCGATFFPPRSLCQKCRSKGKIEDFTFSGEGEIVSWTIIRTAPEGFERQAPYPVAIIKLKEGTKVAGQIVDDAEKIQIGKKVRPVFRRLFTDGSDGLIHYGLKFEIVG